MLERVKWELVHPSCRSVFRALETDLNRGYQAGATHSDFRAFEGFRSPDRQQLLFDEGRTRARPWQSAHQYGLAVDFVVWRRGRWTWELDEDWDYLRRAATMRGLDNSIAWDRAHVESPLFKRVKDVLTPHISGVLA